MKLKNIFMLMFTIATVASAQDMPIGWTSHYRIRLYGPHQNPGPDSLDANYNNLDAAIYNGDKGTTTFNPSVTLGVSNSIAGFVTIYTASNTNAGTLSSAILGAARAWTLPDAGGTIGLINGGQNYTNIGSLNATGAVTFGQSGTVSVNTLYFGSTGGSFTFGRNTAEYIQSIQDATAIGLLSTGKNFKLGTADANPIIFATNNRSFGSIDQNGNWLVYTNGSGVKFLDTLSRGTFVGIELQDGVNPDTVPKITNYPELYNTETKAVSPAYPFNNNGNLIIQPRTNAARDIVIMNGTVPTVRAIFAGSDSSLTLGPIIGTGAYPFNAGKVRAKAGIFGDTVTISSANGANYSGLRVLMATGNANSGAQIFVGVQSIEARSGVIRYNTGNGTQLIGIAMDFVIGNQYNLSNLGGIEFFTQGNQRRMRIEWDGRTGIGTITPLSTSLLTLKPPSSNPELYLFNATASSSSNGGTLDSLGNLAVTGILSTGGSQRLNASGNLLNIGTISATGAVTITGNVANTIVDASTWGSSTYASQTTGWRAGAGGQADFRYLFVDEMHAKSFIADLEQALAGSQIITKSVAKVAADLTIPAAGSPVTIVVEEYSGFTGNVFVNGDIVRLRQFARADNSSLNIADVWGTVVFVSRDGTANPTTQTYTYTRSSGGNAGSAVAGTTIKKGTIALDYGVTSGGYWETTAIDGVNGANSPYAQAVTWTTHPAAGLTVQLRSGNLAGITDADLGGALSGFGIYTSNGYFKGNIFVKSGTAQTLQNAAIQIGNITGTANSAVKLTNTGTASTSGIFAYTSAGVEKFALRLDGTANIAGWAFTATRISSPHVSIDDAGEYISLGATPPTTYGANVGAFLGINAGVATMSLYQNATNYLQWDGSKLTWQAANTTLDASGNLTATSATLSGSITASSGAIAGWTISSTAITKSTGAGTTDAQVYLTTDLDAAARPGQVIGWGNGVGTNPGDGHNFITIGGGSYLDAAIGQFTSGWDNAGGGIAVNSGAKAIFFVGTRPTHGGTGGAIAGWNFNSTTISSTGITLTSDATTASIAFGTTPPTGPATGTGVYIDKTGVYGLASSVAKFKLDATSGLITAATVTAGTFNTATSGERIEINGSTAGNHIAMFDASNLRLKSSTAIQYYWAAAQLTTAGIILPAGGSFVTYFPANPSVNQIGFVAEYQNESGAPTNTKDFIGYAFGDLDNSGVTTLNRSSGSIYGSYGQFQNNLNGTTGKLYGGYVDVSSLSAQDQYGYYALVGAHSGIGGNSYGVYSSVAGATTSYGIYATATGTTAYAAYFAAGNVKSEHNIDAVSFSTAGAAGFLTSALGAKSATIGTVGTTALFLRTITVNGTTVHVVTSD
jgi:hypothetical protein